MTERNITIEESLQVIETLLLYTITKVIGEQGDPFDVLDQFYEHCFVFLKDERPDVDINRPFPQSRGYVIH